MELGVFEYYLIIVNIVGFILCVINTWLYAHTDAGQVDAALTITSLLGGSIGVLSSILIFDRKAQKGNMMSRVFIACIFVIQIIIFLIMKGYIAENITFAFWNFFAQHKFLIVYLAVINIVTFITFAIDKRAAIKGKSRIRIVTLLGLTFIGGSIGGLVAMYVFRHKTRLNYFTVGVPLIMVMQVIVIFYMMNMA